VPKEATTNARFEEAVDLRVPLVGRALKIVQRRLKAVGKSGLAQLACSQSLRVLVASAALVASTATFTSERAP